MKDQSIKRDQVLNDCGYKEAEIGESLVTLCNAILNSLSIFIFRMSWAA